MDLESNADFYDIRVLKSSGLAVFIDNGKIEEISNTCTQGIACRVLIKGSWGFATSDKPEEIKKVLSSATRLASRINLKSPRPGIDLAVVDHPCIHDLPVVKKNPEDISIEEKVELFLEIQKRAKVPGVSSTSMVYSQSLIEEKYSNSEGVETNHSLVRSGFAISAVASSNGVFQMGRESRFEVCGYEIFDTYDAFKLAEKAGTTAKDLLSAQVPKGGRMPVILDQELAGVFIHEAVGHAAEADHVVEGNSILTGKIGDRIGGSHITVIDDPTMHGFGYYPVDDEGVESVPVTVIEDGVLRSYLHSRETAALLPGTGRPGHARSQGLSRPIVRMSNTYIKNGDSDFEEMLSEMKNGIYLIGSRGGQVNPGEGVFQFNAEQGYKVEDGELTTHLRDVSLSGHTLDILKNIRSVGCDLKMNSGRCGKGGQLVPVTDGSPHILVSEAMVGGSG